MNERENLSQIAAVGGVRDSSKVLCVYENGFFNERQRAATTEIYFLRVNV